MKWLYQTGSVCCSSLIVNAQLKSIADSKLFLLAPFSLLRPLPLPPVHSSDLSWAAWQPVCARPSPGCSPRARGCGSPPLTWGAWGAAGPGPRTQPRGARRWAWCRAAPRPSWRCRSGHWRWGEWRRAKEKEGERQVRRQREKEKRRQQKWVDREVTDVNETDMGFFWRGIKQIRLVSAANTWVVIPFVMSQRVNLKPKLFFFFIWKPVNSLLY